MKRVTLRITIFFILVLFLSALGILAGRLIPEPPVDEVQYARVALSDARNKNAESYSPKNFRLASLYYDSAMIHWQEQNERFILFREYDEVLGFARQSAAYSTKAGEQTHSNATSLKSKINTGISELNLIVSKINSRFGRYPLPSEVRNRISKGKLMLSEAVVAYNKGAYLQSNRKLSDAGSLLMNAWNHANSSIQEYFTSFPEWQSWVKKTIAESKQKRIAVIIVDKYAGKCFLYQNGIKTMEFDAELGKNWIGDKRHKGDNATPEGMYKVTKKLEGGATKYYKALLINYPNDDDRKRFQSEVQKGTISKSTGIGGLIEIHGHGGKGADWTEGCVALADEEMAKLYKQVKIGTPVTIVGSLVDLNTINGK
jgi:L,D-peptidoglycan transpeptidase YkuD (ErfK/YbiS/YcfS/YnhG family)